jgi:hypothetical protein
MVRTWLIGMGVLAMALLAAFALPIVRARSGGGGGGGGSEAGMTGSAAASQAVVWRDLNPPRDSGAPRLVAASGSDDSARKPVVVELFTSEGCSDCPHADSLLEKLDKTQPVAGAQIIVLSEHVDYWDDIGWRDPYSAHSFSERQNQYSNHFRLDSIYTPQMVVDGRVQFVGSDERGAIRAIENAARAEKTPMTISPARFDGNNSVTLRVEIGAAPADAVLLVAIEDESDVSSVSRGENSGRTLHHVAVVREMSEVGTVARGQNFAKDVTVKFTRNGNSNYRAVVLLQDASSGAILGAASTRFAN